MDKFLGKLTFSFLLGQLAPGFLLVTTLWLIYEPSIDFLEPAPSIVESGALDSDDAGEAAAAVEKKQYVPWIFLLASGALIGIIVDQLNWAGHGTLDRVDRHRLFIKHSILWIVMGPLGVLVPVLIALALTKTEDLVVKEFLPRVDPTYFGHWEWLQNFYLYSAQYLINTALVASVLLVPVSMANGSWGVFAAGWFGIGLLTLLAIRAFNSLFAAEEQLARIEVPPPSHRG